MINMDESHKPHLLSLIRWLLDEVYSAGGDGDAIWYSKYYDINDILPLVKEVNNEQKFPLTIELNGDTINWYRDQECMIITNNKAIYDRKPSWSQCSLEY